MLQFIYVLVDEFKKVRYVGKTKNVSKRLYQHLHCINKTYKSKWIQSILSNGFTLDNKDIYKTRII